VKGVEIISMNRDKGGKTDAAIISPAGREENPGKGEDWDKIYRLRGEGASPETRL